MRDRAARTQLVIDTQWKVADAPDDADLKPMFVHNELLGSRRDLAGHAQDDVHRQAPIVERPRPVFVPPATRPRLATGPLPPSAVPHDLVRPHQHQLPRPHD